MELVNGLGEPAPGERRPADLPRHHVIRGVRLEIATIIGVGCMVIAALWLVIFVLISNERHAAVERARSEANILSAAFQEQVGGRLKAISQVVDVIADRLRSDPKFDLVDWVETRPMLTAQLVRSIGIVAPDGTLRATTQRRHPPSLDFSDRTYFRAVAAPDGPSTYVSSMEASRLSSGTAIHIARRVTGTDGRLLAVIVVSLVPDQITQLHRSGEFSTRAMSLVLLGTDRVIRARFSAQSPDGTSGVGKLVPPLPTEPSGQVPVIDAVRDSVVDHVPRLYSMRLIPGYPLMANVAFELSEVLEPVAAHARLVRLIGIVATTMLVVLMLLLIIELRRRTTQAKELAAEQIRLADEMRHGESVQRQLRASEARLRDFANTASDWYWEQDAELRFVNISADTPLLAPGDRSHLGKCRWEVNDVEQAPELWQSHREDLLARRPFRDFRYSRIGPDGRMRHVCINGVPVYDENGVFAGYRGTGRDVTDDVDAAAALRAAKERAEQAETLLRDAVDSISEGFVIFDCDDRFVMCNEPYRRAYPVGADLLVPGATFESIIRGILTAGGFPDAQGREEEWLAERLQRRQHLDGPFEQRSADGRWLLMSDQRMRSGGSAGLRTDITDLKRAQIALQDSERRLRDYADTSSDWFWEQDAELRFTWVADTCMMLATGAAAYRGKRRWEVPSARATSDAEWQRHQDILRARLPFRDFRYTLWGDDGRLRHVSISGKPVLDAEARFIGYRGTGRDITAEVEAEVELRWAKERAEQAETLLRDAVDSMSEGFVIYDRDDRFVMCNEAYRQIYPQGAELMVPGARFADILRKIVAPDGTIAPNSREAGWYDRLLRHHREARGAGEQRPREDLWVLSTDRRMRNGGIAGLRIDITALKQTQAALRESEERLDRAQRIAGIGSWELDLATRRYHWSKELYRIRGLSPEMIQPDIDNVAPYLHPDDYRFVRRWLDDLRNGVERDTIETRCVRPDGSVRTLHVEGRAVRDRDGTIRRLTGTMQDVTEKRSMERQLAHAQKMEAIGNLTGGMAHDFNNMLGVIIGNLDLIGRLVRDNPLAEELRADALDGALRGADLVRRLLAFARRQPLQPQQTDVNGLIDRTAKLLGRILGENITLRVRPDAQLPSILVDPAQLEAALTNLATNARDAMPRGGTLEVATRTVVLDARYVADCPEARPGPHVLIEVTDTGTGIPSDLLGRIFEPFFTTKEPGRGSGLGLAMVFGFMKQSGGHVTVYTEEGRGTTFRLYLPFDRRNVGVQPSQDDSDPATGGNETILVVEDNASLRRTAVQQLSALGYQLLQADNADAALALLRTEQSVDLLFSDVVMPGMDGIELAQLATMLRPGIKVLLTSGFPDVRFASERMVASRFRLVSKPYQQRELAKAVREQLDTAILAEAPA